ncbi:hypothetical protein RJT34_30447 [Clitoria ternatea]|uniref:ZF-HD dimerization-type domain-containing protein n=1 Tax=Clitoria ternatea TaxID=43366 RepID=A0AAN9ET39_CLITE
MPSTSGYNNLIPNRNSSSSKLSSPTLASTIGERSDNYQPSQPHHTLVFNDPSQITSHHDHHLYTPSLPSNPLQLPPPHRPRRDPDPSSSSPPIIVTTSTPIRTTPTHPQTTTGITTTTTTTTPSVIRYRECLKNHAASMGGHVTDGCGEFMPSGEEGSLESFKCAACDCHRNFHRKEAEGESQQNVNFNQHHNNKNNVQTRTMIHSPQSHVQFPTAHSSLQLHNHRLTSSSSHGMVMAIPSGGLMQPMMVGMGGGPAESSSEDLNMFQPTSDGGQLVSVQPPLSSKKRFRTKFTQQQKDRMMEFAEKLGWKIQKQDEQELHQFCSQVGVNRQVFKVWMHNSKQSMKKKQM